MPVKNWIYWAATVPSSSFRITWWLACTLGIAVACLIPAGAFRSVGFLAEYGDKAAHTAMYAVYLLAWCWAWPLRARRDRVWLGAVVAGCIAYGGVMEVLQGSLTFLQREFSGGDVAANALGACSGAWLWWRAIPAPVGSRPETKGSG